MSSGPRVKHCSRVSLPNTITQAPPPPRTDMPPSINDIPTSTVTLKSAPLPPPPPRDAPAKKKRVPNNPSPFFDGVYGRPLFSLAPVRHYSSIPDGKSIIFNFYRKALPHEMKEGSTYILIDVYENLWLAPEVFLKWREAVDSGATNYFLSGRKSRSLSSSSAGNASSSSSSSSSSLVLLLGRGEKGGGTGCFTL